MTIEEALRICEDIQNFSPKNIYYFNSLSYTQYTNFAKIYQNDETAGGKVIDEKEIKEIYKILNALPREDFMFVARLTWDMDNAIAYTALPLPPPPPPPGGGS